MTETSTDFAVNNQGSIFLLMALSDNAKAWVEANLPEDRQTFGLNTTVVEHRYILSIIEGIQAEGMSIENI